MIKGYGAGMADHEAWTPGDVASLARGLTQSPVRSVLMGAEPSQVRLRWGTCIRDTATGASMVYSLLSAVYLNGLAVNAALAKLGAWISGARTPARWLDIDLIGTAASPGTQIGPRRGPRTRPPGCVDCASAP